MQLVVNEPQAFRFEVNRAALVDPAIHELEQRRIFERCWIYVGHESELGAPGDFKTRTIAGRPVILCRNSENRVRVFLNTCRHRGSLVCRSREGNAERYTCFYHGWTYDRDGALCQSLGQGSEEAVNRVVGPERRRRFRPRRSRKQRSTRASRPSKRTPASSSRRRSRSTWTGSS